MATTQSPNQGEQRTSTVTQPVSAAPAAALTAAERRKRYLQLRERMGRSRLEVIGDPNKHYFWAHRLDENELVRLDTIGFTLVREPNAKEVIAGKKEPLIRASGLKEDGTYVNGDVILMQCDQEIYEYLELHNEEVNNQLMRSAKDDFLFEAEKQGVPVFEVDKTKKK